MRLIDADALKEAVDNGWKPDMMVSELWEIIDEAPTIGGWISVKDRLPERGTRCLIYAAQGKAHYTSICNFNGYYFCLSGKRAYWKVTHWQPLPDSPKEADECSTD